MADLPAEADGADFVILGERHNTPAQIAWMADAVAALAPTALIFEHLLPNEAARLETLLATGTALDPAAFHWPDFPDYLPLLRAAPGARILGAAEPRDRVRAAFANGAAATFSADAGRYGLTAPLPPDEQAAREAEQFAGHCAAMPMEMMPAMVEAQRFRDASFARTVAGALAAHGAPVVLVTGWGHARRDWGVPVYLARVAPEARVYVVGLREEVAAPGLFDHLVVTEPEPGRPDPCAAFGQ